MTHITLKEAIKNHLTHPEDESFVRGLWDYSFENYPEDIAEQVYGDLSSAVSIINNK
jgi:hypothetical protein